jgi:thymidine phosphorylase
MASREIVRGNSARRGGLDGGHRLKARRLGLESQDEPIVLMHKDCPICRSEGFAARARIELRNGDRATLATLYQVGDGFLSIDEAGLSEAAWAKLDAREGDLIAAVHPRPLPSMSAVRAKLYGQRLSGAELREIIGDVAAERYSDVELAAFVAAFSSRPYAFRETAALTRAMVEAGERLSWASPVVADKHSVGGLPGNRTTPIVVAIAAAAGLTIPKTSSRAITSPAGTADVMATMTNVDLDSETMRSVVEREGGCLAWGGSVRLSPADDIIIRVERELDVDCEAQLIASVLSKKIAAGATHVLLDIPVGPTAKVRTDAQARGLSDHLVEVGAKFGLSVLPSISDGTEPVGRGIGPALEARDVLAVLRNSEDAPKDLRQRSLTLASRLLAFAGGVPGAQAARRAQELLDSGAALGKFMAICAAQGGFREPPVAPLRETIHSRGHGVVALLDNRLLARAAKLAGAPRAASAGLEMHVKLRQRVSRGTPLITLHAESEGELAYAQAFVDANPDMIRVSPL